MLYVYVDGSDLDEIQGTLVSRFDQLAHRWSSLDAYLVNERSERTPDLRPDDLVDWDLGVNMPLENLGLEQVDELLPFLRALAEETGREFVIGIGLSSGVSEDVIAIGATAGDRERKLVLAQILGL